MFFKHVFLLSFLAVATLTFTSCGNDDDNEVKFAETDLTIDAGWNVTRIETNLDDLAPIIVAAIDSTQLNGLEPGFVEALFTNAAKELETLQDCEKDDLYKFMEAGTISYSDAETKCDPNDADSTDAVFTDNTTWTLSGDQLTIKDGDDTTIFTIKTLDETNLVVEALEDFEDDTFTVDIDEKVLLRISFVKAN